MREIGINQNFGKAITALRVHKGVAFNEEAELRILYRLIAEYAENIDAALALLEQAGTIEHKVQANKYLGKALNIVARMEDVLREIEIDEKKEG